VSGWLVVKHTYFTTFRCRCHTAFVVLAYSILCCGLRWSINHQEGRIWRTNERATNSRWIWVVCCSRCMIINYDPTNCRLLLVTVVVDSCKHHYTS